MPPRVFFSRLPKLRAVTELDDGHLDGAVHVLDLSVGSGMIGFG
jgi:hypothetical protein